jgi:predicted hydrolase (HD superfamily)
MNDERKKMTREEALKLMQELVVQENIRKHLLSTEVVMRALAKKLEPEKEEDYALAGLLHDGDYNDQTPVEQQGIKVSKLIKDKGYQISDEVAQAMAAHNWSNNRVEPKAKMDWALFCCDSLTGLVVATTLVRPEKKLALVEVKSVLKKFKQPSFAAGTRREDIQMCEEKLGIPLEEFVKLSLEAMQGISEELGL